jgi:hypothetical protein
MTGWVLLVVGVFLLVRQPSWLFVAGGILMVLGSAIGLIAMFRAWRRGEFKL